MYNLTDETKKQMKLAMFCLNEALVSLSESKDFLLKAKEQAQQTDSAAAHRLKNAVNNIDGRENDLSGQINHILEVFPFLGEL